MSGRRERCPTCEGIGLQDPEVNAVCLDCFGTGTDTPVPPQGIVGSRNGGITRVVEIGK